MSKSVRRLFEQFQPQNYNLHISLDHADLSFSGKVFIRGQKVGRPAKRLTFHQKDLKITSAKLTKHGKSGDSQIPVSRINLQKSFDEVRLHTDELLYPGDYTVEIDFSGKVTDSMQGIYPSRFKHRTQPKIILTTQFEANHAREAFPCIDEPLAKATFDISVTDDKDMVTLSNMPEKQVKSIDKTKTTTFLTSPIMSPYLVAFISGPLHSFESKTKNGVIVRSWCAENHSKSHLEYSVGEAVKILEFFEDYFDTPYPLAKYDQVALPDFDAGAMENWGLPTFREVLLLSDPNNRSVTTEQYISLVIAHEASHMWFGDLVTMEWWDDLWLNESFAALMEHLSLDAIHPNWHQWEMYASDDITATTSRDIYRDIQPVSVKVTDPDLIETLFDPGIVYAKGARLLKMLREYIGDEAFRAGLKKYFDVHAYKNTGRADLWAALSESSGQNIDELMTPWLVQSGMPVVHVYQDDKVLRLRQERFTLDASDDASTWPIPLLSDQSLSKTIITKAQENIQLDSSGFVVLNQHGSGHYLVDYEEPAHRQALIDQFKQQKLPTDGRINSLNDMYVLARGGTRSLVDSLEICAENTEETRDGVWSMMLRAIGAAQQLTEGDEQALKLIKQFKVKIANQLYSQLGWDDKPGDDMNTKQLRHTILALMVGGEDKSAIAEAIKRYQSAASLSDLPAEIRSTILGAAVRFGNHNVVDRLLSAYPESSAEIQGDITAALASTRDPKIAKHILETALGDDGIVRPQDLMRWFVNFYRNPYVRSVAWQYLGDNWDWFKAKFSASKSFDFLPTYVASAITTENWLKKYQAFFTKLGIKELKHNTAIGISDAKSRIAWRQRDEKLVVDFFKAQAQKP